MKNKFIFTMLFLIILTCNIAGQTTKKKKYPGFSGFYTMAADKDKDPYDFGFGFEFLGNIATKSEYIQNVLGISFTLLHGNKIEGSNDWYSYSIEFDDSEIISFFTGFHFGEIEGPYFLPTIAANIIDNDLRIGLNLGIGLTYDNLNIGSKLRLINMFMQEEPEKDLTFFEVTLGLMFY